MVICGILRVKQRHHSFIEETVWFHEVDDVKSVLPASPCITNLKVKPLSVILGPIVRFHYQLVLKLVQLDCFFEVA